MEYHIELLISVSEKPEKFRVIRSDPEKARP
jgi:hypothetical protein